MTALDGDVTSMSSHHCLGLSPPQILPTPSSAPKSPGTSQPEVGNPTLIIDLIQIIKNNESIIQGCILMLNLLPLLYVRVQNWFFCNKEESLGINFLPLAWFSPLWIGLDELSFLKAKLMLQHLGEASQHLFEARQLERAQTAFPGTEGTHRRWQGKDPAMEPYLWKGLLMVGAAVAASARPAPNRPLSFEDVVSYVVQAYNQLEERTSSFQLLEATAPPEWDAKAEGSQQDLTLTIKETVCDLHQKKSAEECNFKADGVEKVCSGIYTIEQSYRFILAQCDDEEKKPELMLQERWNKLRKNLIKKFRKAGAKYAAAVAVTIA